MIPKGEIPTPVLSQPSEPWGVMPVPLSSRPGGGRAGFGAGIGLCWGMWHGVKKQGVAGRVTSPSGKRGERWKTPGRREKGDGERVERQGKLPAEQGGGDGRADSPAAQESTRGSY